MLSRFFYQNYEGETLPRSFEHVLIEADRNGVVFSIACTHEGERIYIDCYVANVCVCKVDFSNAKSSKGFDGHFEVRPNVEADKVFYSG